MTQLEMGVTLRHVLPEEINDITLRCIAITSYLWLIECCRPVSINPHDRLIKEIEKGVDLKPVSTVPYTVIYYC